MADSTTTPRPITRLADLWNPQEGRPLRAGDSLAFLNWPDMEPEAVTVSAGCLWYSCIYRGTAQPLVLGKRVSGYSVPLADLLPYLTRPTEGSAR